LDAGAMSGHSRQMALLGPAAVAIHDYGDVLREPVAVKFADQPFFFSIPGFERFRYVHAISPANSARLPEVVSRA